MVDRVKAFHSANIFEPHTYNHLIGRPNGPENHPARSRPAATFRSSASWKTAGWTCSPPENIWTRWFSKAVPELQERVVVLDLRNVDILIVVPL